MTKVSPDLTGQKFGRLTVIARAPKYLSQARWECLCECGETRINSVHGLTKGRVKSCGCLSREVASNRCRARNTTHGKCHSSEYSIWHGMKQRCITHPRYAGRGISVCERWQSFENFFADMGPLPARNYSLDRINNDGNYEPGNCRWATIDEQANNRVTNRVVSYRGANMTLIQAIRAAGSLVDKGTCWSRLADGWSIERAVETPPIRRERAA